MDLHAYLARQAERIHAALDRLIPPESTPPETIHRAMRYSLFAGGKRIRPLLALAAGHCLGCDDDSLVDAACALELVHTYSLIHDDLPALDNDDLRRGRPTSHKVFGEAMAILAGDALLTHSFLVLARLSALPPARRILLVEELASAAGTVGGMIAGQVHDLEGEYLPPAEDILERIHRAKTGAMLRASVRFGALYAGAASAELDALTRYGQHIGLAFQIVDDLLDVEESSEHLGKTAGKDAAQHKITFPAVYGLARSHRMAEAELESALACLAPFGEQARWLRELANLIVHRKA